MESENLKVLEELHTLKENKVITELEYDAAKTRILQKDFISKHVEETALESPRLGQGISLLVGSVFCFFTLCAVFSAFPEHPKEDDINGLFGVVFLFALWVVPHGIYVLCQKGSNIIFPILALSFLGFCFLCCVGAMQ